MKDIFAALLPNWSSCQNLSSLRLKLPLVQGLKENFGKGGNNGVDEEAHALDDKCQQWIKCVLRYIVLKDIENLKQFRHVLF